MENTLNVIMFILERYGIFAIFMIMYIVQARKSREDMLRREKESDDNFKRLLNALNSMKESYRDIALEIKSKR